MQALHDILPACADGVGQRFEDAGEALIAWHEFGEPFADLAGFDWMTVPALGWIKRRICEECCAD